MIITIEFKRKLLAAELGSICYPNGSLVISKPIYTMYKERPYFIHLTFPLKHVPFYNEKVWFLPNKGIYREKPWPHCIF